MGIWEEYLAQAEKTYGNAKMGVKYWEQGVGFPADGDTTGQRMFVTSAQDMPNGLTQYLDTNGDLAYKWERDTSGLQHVTVDTDPAYSEEHKRAATESTCTPATAALTDQAIYCCTATLTADANGDLGVLNSGQITPDVASYNIRLLKVESAVTLANTAGAARCEVISNDATPKIWTNPDLGDSMTFPRTGNQQNAAVNKHWAVIGGGLTAAADYTFYAWFRAED